MEKAGVKDMRINRNVLIYMCTFLLAIGGYFLKDLLWNGHNFILVFSFLGLDILAILFLYKQILGSVFWKSLPFVISIYILLALFIPTVVIYKSELLKELVDWDDKLILDASSLGLVFIQSLWIFYSLGTALFPVAKRESIIRVFPMSRIYILVFLTLATNIVAVLSGTFGILQKTDMASTANFSAYIDLGQQLGLFSLVILTYQYSHRKYLIGAICLLLFILGIISAQKQAALMPLLAVMVTLYFKNGRLPKGVILVAVAAVLFTFAAVSTIRQYYFAQKSSGVTSISEVKAISENALNQKTFNKAYKTYNVNDHIMMRLFYGSAIGKAIAYCERNGYGVPEDSKLYQVLFSPFYAIVPRIIMPQKPEANFGNWFASEVFVGFKVKYSIGITPIGYGYMIHGVMGVMAVAALLGLFMAIIYKWLYLDHLLIYILVLIKTLLPADVTWEYIAGNIKFIIVYLVLYELLMVRIFSTRQSDSQINQTA